MKYRTIVADPPWDHSDPVPVYINGVRHSRPGLPYSHMELEDICGLPVASLAERDAHLYLWGGSFTSSAEFVLFCRRGILGHTAVAGRQWWQWPRGEHSQKPEAFLDIVEMVSPGPYLELFARRQRLGWDTWGNEALEHVEVMA